MGITIADDGFDPNTVAESIWKDSPKPTAKSSKGLDVPAIVDDELDRLGYPEATRLALLGNLGRENSWNANTIFGGHSDPKNQAPNRGLMSWQGDRRTQLEDFIHQNGGDWTPNEDNIRLQTRFLDNELRTNYPKIYKTVTNPNADISTVSRDLRNYIKYVPTAPYNTPDPEFDVKANREWAMKAQRQGLAQFNADRVAQGVWNDTLDPNATAQTVWNQNPGQNEQAGQPAQPIAAVPGQLPENGQTPAGQPAGPTSAPLGPTDPTQAMQQPQAALPQEEPLPVQRQRMIDLSAQTAKELQRAKTPARRNILIQRQKDYNGMIGKLDQQIRAQANAPKTATPPPTVSTEPPTATAQPTQAPDKATQPAVAAVSQTAPAAPAIETQPPVPQPGQSDVTGQPAQDAVPLTLTDKAGQQYRILEDRGSKVKVEEIKPDGSPGSITLRPERVFTNLKDVRASTAKQEAVPNQADQEAQDEAAKANAQFAQENQAKAAQIQRSLKPPKKQQGQYTFQKTGTLTLPAVMGESAGEVFKYQPDATLEKNGEYRFMDADNNPFVYVPSTGKVAPENDETSLRDVPVPLGDPGADVRAVKQTQGATIASAIADMLPNVPQKDITDFFATRGLSHFDTKQDLTDPEYLKGFVNPVTGTTDAPVTAPYHVTQRGLNQIEAYSQQKQDEKAKYNDAFKQAVSEGDDPFAADISAKVAIGQISAKKGDEIIAAQRPNSPENLRAMAIAAIRQENAPSMGAGKVDAQGNFGEKYQPSEDEIAAKVKELSDPEAIASRERVAKDANEIVNDLGGEGLTGQAKLGLQAVAGSFDALAGTVLRPFSSVPGLSDLYKTASEKSQARALAFERGGDDSWAGFGIRHGVKTAGDLLQLSLLAKLPGISGDMPLTFAVQGAANTFGQGGNAADTTKAFTSGYALGKVFDGATKAESLVANIGKKAVVTEEVGNNAFLNNVWKGLSQEEKDAQIALMKDTTLGTADKRFLLLNNLVGKMAGGAVIVGGTAGLGKASGENNESIADQTATNLLFHFGPSIIHGAVKLSSKGYAMVRGAKDATGPIDLSPDALDKIAGRVARVWENGEPHDYFVDAKGQMNETARPVPTALVEMEAVADPQNPIYKNQAERRATAAVPETGGQQEGQQYGSAVEEIRAKGADTKAKIQELFPQISREEAADLRKQAFPDGPVKPNETKTEIPEPQPQVGEKSLVSDQPLEGTAAADVPSVSEETPKDATNPTGSTKPQPLSNTQIEFSGEQAKPFEEFRKNVIEASDVADKSVLPEYAKDGIHGIEPHVTVKYGLHTNNHEDVVPILKGEKPIEVELGKTSVFKGSEKKIPGTEDPVPYDVVTVKVKSDDLERLNKKLTDGSENTTTFPYSPHVTLAYVKPGEGEKYAGRTDFEGQKYTFDGVTFSPADKSGKTVLPLEGTDETPTRIDKPDAAAVKRANNDPRMQRVESLLTGDFQTIDEIGKVTRMKRFNLERALSTLYKAGRIEILPGDRVRRISEPKVEKTPVDFFTRVTADTKPPETKPPTEAVAQAKETPESLAYKGKVVEHPISKEVLTFTGEVNPNGNLIAKNNFGRERVVAVRDAEKWTGSTPAEGPKSAEAPAEPAKAETEPIETETPAKADTPADAPAKAAEPIATPKAVPSKQRSLSQFVRSMGGIKPTAYDKGEAARLRNKETGTTGLINKNSKYTAEQMAEIAHESGYLRDHWQDITDRNGNDFMGYVEDDLHGIRKHYAMGDHEELHKDIAKQEDEYYAQKDTADKASDVYAQKMDEMLAKQSAALADPDVNKILAKLVEPGQYKVDDAFGLPTNEITTKYFDALEKHGITDEYSPTDILAAYRTRQASENAVTGGSEDPGTRQPQADNVGSNGTETVRTVSHPNPEIDGKPILAETSDGRVVVPNEDNKSGISVVTNAENPWVARAKKDGIVVANESITDADAKALQAAVKSGELVKDKGGQYPQERTVYARPDFDIKAHREEGLAELRHAAAKDKLQSALRDAKASDYGASNKLVTVDRAQAARKLLAKKLGGNQLNAGIDPEILRAGAELALFHVEAGARSFAKFSKAMIEDVGDAIEPHLHELYNKVRDEHKFEGMDEPVKADSPKADVPVERSASDREISPEGKVTSTKHAVVDAERESRGLKPIMNEITRDFGTVARDAQKILDNNPAAGSSLVNELLRHPERNLTDTENAILTYHKVELTNNFDKLSDDLFKAHGSGNEADVAAAQIRLAPVADALDAIDRATSAAGTAAGRGLNVRKMMMAEDYSLAALQRKSRASVGGRELTTDEIAHLKTVADDFKAKNEALQAHLKNRDDKIAEIELRLAQREATASAIPPHIIATAEKIVNQLESRADAARARLAKRGAVFTSGLDPLALKDLAEIGAAHIGRVGLDFAKFSDKMIGEFGEKIRPHLQSIFDEAHKYINGIGVSDRAKSVIKKTNTVEYAADRIKAKIAAGESDISGYVQQIARKFVENGITDRTKLLDAVHNVLKDIDPEMTRRDTMDALSGYGKYKQLSKDAIDVTLRDLKGQMQQIAKLEDMASGKAPAKTGVEHRSPSDEERRLTQQVEAAKKEGGYVVTDPETQLKTALASAKTRLRNSIADLEKQIATKEKIVKTQRSIQYDEEAINLKTRRDELKKQFDEIFGKPGMTDEARLKAWKSRTAKRIDEISTKLAEGDFSKKPKPDPITNRLDAEGLKLRAEVEDVKNRFNRELKRNELENRTRWEKIQDGWTKYRRAVVLSGASTIGKLFGAAVSRMGTNMVEQAAEHGYGKIFPGLADRMGREYGFRTRAEAQSATSFFTDGMKDAWRLMKHQDTDLETVFGKPHLMPKEIIEYLGSLHGAMKAPLKRAAFTRNYELRMMKVIKDGGDPMGPATQMVAGLEAYKSGERSIFMQDNVLTDAYKSFLHTLERKGSSGNVNPAGKLLATAMKTLLPIVKIPTNFVAETGKYVYGLPVGLGKVAMAKYRGFENLDPHQAEAIMRLLKKGTPGAVAMLVGASFPEVFGGFYEPGKRDKKDVAAMGIRLGGVDIPPVLLHNPLFYAAQVGSTFTRAMNTQISKDSKETKGAGMGILAAVLGLVEEVPFLREAENVSKLGDPSKTGTAAAELLRGAIIPQLSSQIASYMDKPDVPNKYVPFMVDPIKRKPTTFGEIMKMAIPGLRQTVPADAMDESRISPEAMAAQNKIAQPGKIMDRIEALPADTDATELRNLLEEKLDKKAAKGTLTATEAERANKILGTDKYQGQVDDPEAPEFPEANKDADSVIGRVVGWAEGFGSDPVDAFNKLVMQGETFRRLENGAIIVKRMDKKLSEAERRRLGGGGKEVRLDHTVPLEIGGTNAQSNLRLVTTEEWSHYTPVENYLGKALHDGAIDRKAAAELITNFKNGNISKEDVIKAVGKPFTEPEPKPAKEPKATKTQRIPGLPNVNRMLKIPTLR